MSSNPLDVEPRDAATLAILRDGPGGLEVLVTLRPRSLRFMGGATVFPGGGLSPSDSDPRWEHVSTLSMDEAAERTGESRDRALSFFVCALRESFEEVGFIIGTGDLPAPGSVDDEALLGACLDAGATVALDRFVGAGQWVTPLGAPVRFDTRFFCVAAPDGWEPQPNPSEVETCSWVTPVAALDQLSRGDALMAPPTIEMLQLLAKHDTVDSVLEGISSEAMTGAGKVLSVRASPLVHIVLAPNPGIMTGPGTNTYIVGAGPTFVIDPAVDDEDYLDEVLAKAGEVSAILVTHRHSDHVGGAAAIAARTGAPVRAFGPEPAGAADVLPIEDSDVLEAGGVSLRTMYCPGHASDHLCWMLDAAASLFAGDNVLGEGTAVIAPPDGDMKAYLATLKKLAALHIDRIYPGHFRWRDGGHAVIEGYLAHRRDRERQVLEALAGGAQSVAEIVRRVYTDTPEHLHPVAAYSVLAHLEMLEENEEVIRRNDLWSVRNVQ